MSKVPHILIAFTIALLLTFAAAQNGTTVATDLNGPMGLLVDDDGNLWIIDSGLGGDESIDVVNPQMGEAMSAPYGDTSRIIRVGADGSQEVMAHLPSINLTTEMAGGARLALLNGSVYATMGFWIEGTGDDPGSITPSVVRIEDGEVVRVADLWAFEHEHNPDGFVVESHPYGLAAGPDGMLWVADAGANTLLRVDPSSGSVELMATLDGLPGPMPNPARGGAMEADPVPTGITVGADGTIYLALLSGFPFVPGSAKVMTVSPDGELSDYATGLSTLTDVQAAPDGNLYAVRVFLFGEQGPGPDSGAVYRIANGEVTEVLTGLSVPTAIAFNQAGDAFVTINGAGGPGGAVLRFDGLASGD